MDHDIPAVSASWLPVVAIRDSTEELTCHRQDSQQWQQCIPLPGHTLPVGFARMLTESVRMTQRHPTGRP